MLKVIRLPDGLVQLNLTVTQEQFEFLTGLATELSLEPDTIDLPTYRHDCSVVDISDGPCGDPSCGESASPKGPFKVLKEHCPECVDGYKIERTNKQTQNTFMGCTEWPDCEFSEQGGSRPAPRKYEDYDSDEIDYPDLDCFY